MRGYEGGNSTSVKLPGWAASTARWGSVFEEVIADWDGRSLVEEDAHLELEQIWGWLCLSRELQYSLDLFAVEAVVPLQEVVDGCSGLGVLEDGGDGHAGVAEDHAPLSFPGTASTSGHPDQLRFDILGSVLQTRV